MNKLWYRFFYDEERSKLEAYSKLEMEGLIANRQYIQKYIDLYCQGIFSVPEDITTDNLQQFLEIILKYYQLYLFDLNELINLSQSVCNYLHKAYLEDFPDTAFPYYPKNDRRELVLYLLQEIDGCQSILPEDVPTLIKCFNVSEKQIIDMYDYIDNYLNQFDLSKRFNNSRLCVDLVNKQRKKAIDKGQPLPIRPMGIELDLCYKK